VRNFKQVDAFTDRPFMGNPVAVVMDGQGLDTAQMQHLAHWTNLSETTFLLPSTVADYKLRIFSPRRELPFAGHPTIGSAHAALHSGFAHARGGRLVQECGAGLLPIGVDEREHAPVLFVRAPAAAIVRAGPRQSSRLGDLLSGRSLGHLPPALVEGGRRWWVVEFADEGAVRGWQPDHAAIAAIAKADDCLGVCVFARCADRDHDVVVRAFPAGVGIVEDPASGAANGLIAAWIARSEPGGALARGYRVSQGREIGHDASIMVRIEDDEIWVGGMSSIVVDGTLNWPLDK